MKSIKRFMKDSILYQARGELIRPMDIFYIKGKPNTIYIAYLGLNENIRRRVIYRKGNKPLGETSNILDKDICIVSQAELPQCELALLKPNKKFIILRFGNNWSRFLPVASLHKKSTTSDWQIKISHSGKITTVNKLITIISL